MKTENTIKHNLFQGIVMFTKNYRCTSDKKKCSCQESLLL